MIGNPNDETNFPHKWLLTDTQVARLCKAFVKLTNHQLILSYQQIEYLKYYGFRGGHLGPLLIFGLPLMNNVILPWGLF